MSFEDTNDQPRANFAPREKIQGNWKCSECGAEITELPFQPTEGRPIFCTECWKNRKPTNFRR